MRMEIEAKSKFSLWELPATCTVLEVYQAGFLYQFSNINFQIKV
jgi:hypothetical protein